MISFTALRVFILEESNRMTALKGSTASGIVGTDNVTLGGLCIEGQAIELASKLSPQFTSGAGDGLLGLAFGHINTVKPKKVATPVEQVSLSMLTSFPYWRLTTPLDDSPIRHPLLPRALHLLSRLLAR